METRKLVALMLFAVMVAGCVPCPALRATDLQGQSHRIFRPYVEEYSCAPFREMTTTEQMVAWCVSEGLGDTVSSDVAPGCRPGERPGGCERFWVCE